MSEIKDLSDKVGVIKFLLDKLDSNDDSDMWKGIIKHIELYKINRSLSKQRSKKGGKKNWEKNEKVSMN